MKRLIITSALLVLISGCGTLGITFPMPSTMACLKAAEDNANAVYIDLEKGEIVPISADERAQILQNGRNECLWDKAHDKKD